MDQVIDNLDSLDRQAIAADGSMPPGRSAVVMLSQREILKLFSPEDQETIQHRLYVLSGLSQRLGRDFRMRAELSQPGKGWYWNEKKKNIVGVDANDLVSLPLDYVRGLFIHEGTHRFATDYTFITNELMAYPSFHLLMNALEDARINNLATDLYPSSQGQLDMLYKVSDDSRQSIEGEAEVQVGFKPKSFLAAFELLRLWFEERSGRPIKVQAGLPQDVVEFIRKAYPAAHEMWWTYPSREEIEAYPGIRQTYCHAAYDIVVRSIWPEFKKLVDDDLKHTEFIQMLSDFNSPGMQIPVQLASELTSEELEALLAGLEAAGAGAPCAGMPGGCPSGIIIMDKLPPDLLQKLKDLMEKLPPAARAPQMELAQDTLDKLADAASSELEGPDSGASTDATPDSAGDAFPRDEEEPMGDDDDFEDYAPPPLSYGSPGKPRDSSARHRTPPGVGYTPHPHTPTQDPAEIQEAERIRRAADSSPGRYDTLRADASPIINRLENELRAIFIERKRTKWLAGNRWGQKLNIPLRIKEIARGVSPANSKIFMRRLAPRKQDYAISLLVDLSGSMGGQKITETLKAAITMAEVFSRLGIKFEILGFNCRLFEFKSFRDQFNQKIRHSMGSMISETGTPRAAYNDDGWALTKAAARLRQVNATDRFLIALSDGYPAPSNVHCGAEFELSHVINLLMGEKDIKLVGLGIGEGTGHVSYYYPNSVSDIPVTDLPKSLAELLRAIITLGDHFR